MRKFVDAAKMDANGSELNKEKPTIVFVLGGPGCGKGTQCAKIVKQFGYTHLSVGDLLRDEVKSNSENGSMIQRMMKEGKLVPSSITVKLQQQAMLRSGNKKFLIDGFPRDEENRVAFENMTKLEPAFVLFFDCPVEELKTRLLNRNEGREDDNTETIRKRIKVYFESTLPVVDYYNSKGKVRKIDASRSVEEVFESVEAVFSQNNQEVYLHNCHCWKLDQYRLPALQEKIRKWRSSILLYRSM